MPKQAILSKFTQYSGPIKCFTNIRKDQNHAIKCYEINIKKLMHNIWPSNDLDLWPLNCDNTRQKATQVKIFN